MVFDVNDGTARQDRRALDLPNVTRPVAFLLRAKSCHSTTVFI